MEAKIEELKSKINGRIILPQDREYDDARKVYNAMIDKHPGIILKCRDKEDVIHAVNFSRENGMEASIRSGGHSGAGLALCEDGLVIDLSEMKHIEVDPQDHTAEIGPGNMLKDIDAETHKFGLALPSGIIGTTGIGGITLGGGIGYLSRKGGLTIDNLLECKIVLASGELVTANSETNADLFWALRGGGGNFGVVVSFKFKLLEIKNVYAGPMFWPLDKAEEAMRFFDKTLKEASNDLYGFFAFLVVPPADPFPKELQMQKVCGIVWNYTGPMDKAEEVFKPLRNFGPPILDFVSEIPMPALNGMFDDLYPTGLQWYWKAHYINELSDESIRVNIDFGSQIPTFHSTTHLYPIDGAVQEVAPEDTAWANRGARYAQVIVGVSPEAEDAQEITAWCRNYYEALKPHSSGGAYVNFMMEEEEGRIEDSYGSNFKRLRQVKKKYDPENFFHINQNITPCD